MNDSLVALRTLGAHWTIIDTRRSRFCGLLFQCNKCLTSVKLTS